MVQTDFCPALGIEKPVSQALQPSSSETAPLNTPVRPRGHSLQVFKVQEAQDCPNAVQFPYDPIWHIDWHLVDI